MIKEKILMPGIEFRIKNGSSITLQDVANLIKQKADGYAAPVAFKPDQVTPDLIAGLLGTKEDCIVLFHPNNEKNYLRYVIRAHRQGTYLFLLVNKTNGYAVDSAASRAVTAVRSMFSEENHWITIIDDIFEELFT